MTYEQKKQRILQQNLAELAAIDAEIASYSQKIDDLKKSNVSPEEKRLTYKFMLSSLAVLRVARNFVIQKGKVEIATLDLIEEFKSEQISELNQREIFQKIFSWRND